MTRYLTVREALVALVVLFTAFAITDGHAEEVYQREKLVAIDKLSLSDGDVLDKLYLIPADGQLVIEEGSEIKIDGGGIIWQKTGEVQFASSCTFTGVGSREFYGFHVQHSTVLSFNECVFSDIDLCPVPEDVRKLNADGDLGEDVRASLHNCMVSARFVKMTNCRITHIGVSKAGKALKRDGDTELVFAGMCHFDKCAFLALDLVSGNEEQISYLVGLSFIFDGHIETEFLQKVRVRYYLKRFSDAEGGLIDSKDELCRFTECHFKELLLTRIMLNIGAVAAADCTFENITIRSPFLFIMGVFINCTFKSLFQWSDTQVNSNVIRAVFGWHCYLSNCSVTVNDPTPEQVKDGPRLSRLGIFVGCGEARGCEFISDSSVPMVTARCWPCSDKNVYMSMRDTVIKRTKEYKGYPMIEVHGPNVESFAISDCVVESASTAFFQCTDVVKTKVRVEKTAWIAPESVQLSFGKAYDRGIDMCLFNTKDVIISKCSHLYASTFFAERVVASDNPGIFENLFVNAKRITFWGMDLEYLLACGYEPRDKYGPKSAYFDLPETKQMTEDEIAEAERELASALRRLKEAE
ncbi:MAG: hypothetical protein U5N86_04945 [Planctomycetota bacterium]|nr:hypothetical protein [Planctomycetota bacterium]